ncbi:hypothetical protein COO60DRAFT_876624 [Scenedesmus sp. NREL 46B-D3]|nr:hypothetical protein COO60DRAFT_876624 [Scenedesmus sp. NREL 46B-D3]
MLRGSCTLQWVTQLSCNIFVTCASQSWSILFACKHCTANWVGKAAAVVCLYLMSLRLLAMGLVKELVPTL